MEYKYPSIINDLPAEEYFKIPALNQSTLKRILSNPFDAANAEIESNRAIEVGRLVEFLAFGSGEVDDYYAVVPNDAPRRPSKTQINAKNPSESTLRAIEYWTDIYARNKTVIEAEVFSLAVNIARCVKTKFDQVFEVDISDCKVSPTYLFDIDGVNCKARLDIVTPSGQIVDLKVTGTPDPKQFMWQVRRFGYGVQAEWYRCAYRANHRKEAKFYLLVASMVENHSHLPLSEAINYTYVAELDREGYVMRDAVEHIYEGLGIYKSLEKLAPNDWPGYDMGQRIITLDSTTRSTMSVEFED